MYERVLGLGLGLNPLSAKSFSDIVKFMYLPVKDLLDSQCSSSKTDMQALPSDALGSWQKAVTSSDGVWLTRGFHSQNFTFSVWNYLNHSLLYYMHLCMRGSDELVDEPLYPGTSKSAEGYAAEKVFAKAKEEGMGIAANWQDSDSSSAKAFSASYPAEGGSRVMLCGGHVNRAHTKQLKEMVNMKTFTSGFKSRYRRRFPAVDTVKCVCEGKRHSAGCGCLSAGFLLQARINFFCALLAAGTSSDKFRQILMELANHHALGEHEWVGGQCSFHESVVCSCGKCTDSPISCQGKPYQSRSKLTCPLHILAYQIEVDNRASLANSIIHETLGKGHSNIPESAHNVLIRFRSKDLHLHRLHYMLSTNLGLLQANQNWAIRKFGSDYHWIIQLYERLSLPIGPSLLKNIAKENDEAIKNSEYYSSQQYKSKQVLYKRARLMESEERKRYKMSKEHSYGGEGDEMGDAETAEDGVTEAGNVGTSGGKGCSACGGSDHMRRSSRKCALYKVKK